MSRSARARARQHAAKVKSTEPKTQAQKDAHLVAGLLSGEIKWDAWPSGDEKFALTVLW